MRRLPVAAVFAFIFAFAVAGTAWASHAGPLTASCSNPEFGYTVNFPNNWFYNTHVAREEPRTLKRAATSLPKTSR